MDSSGAVECSVSPVADYKRWEYQSEGRRQRAESVVAVADVFLLQPCD